MTDRRLAPRSSRISAARLEAAQVAKAAADQRAEARSGTRLPLIPGGLPIGTLRRLEPRFLFDGAALATADFALDTGDMAADAPAAETAPPDSTLADLAAMTAPATSAAANTSAAPLLAAALPPAQEIIFIDARITQPQHLIAGLPAGAEIIILDPGADGLAQIAEALRGRTDVAAIHIVSHGSDGQLDLGATSVTAQSIATSSAQAASLVAIGQALGADGDILLYGCGVAGTAAGERFVAELAVLTGADVAASSDDTGAAAMGGNWFLEAQTGEIDAALVDAPEWNGLLAPLTISTTAQPTVSGAGGVGTMAIWANAGFVGSTAVDLRATVIAFTPGFAGATTPFFGTAADNPFVQLTQQSEVTLRWEIFAAGTNQTVVASGTPNWTIKDIDGIGGVVNTRESAAPSLYNLQSYTTEAISNVVISGSGATLLSSGTQDQASEPNSAVVYRWSNVTYFDITYRLWANSAAIQARFEHDGDGDFTFVNPVTTQMLALDLDGNDSTAAGTGYHIVVAEQGGQVVIVDADVAVTQHAALGTTLDHAEVVFTNPQAGDIVRIGGAIVADGSTGTVGGFTYTVAAGTGGALSIEIAGSGTPADYQLALQQITFENGNHLPNATPRQFTVVVTNDAFGTTSATALSTIEVLPLAQAPHLDLSGPSAFTGGILYGHNGTTGTPSWQSPAGLATLASVANEVAGAGVTFSYDGSALEISGVGATSLEQAIAKLDYVSMTFATLGTMSETWVQDFAKRNSGGSYEYALAISTDGFQTATLLSDHNPGVGAGSGYGADVPWAKAVDFQLQPGTSYEVRAYLYNAPSGTARWDDFYLFYSTDPTSHQDTFTEGGAAVAIAAPAVEIEDVNNSTMTAATVTLTNKQVSDRLLISSNPLAGGDTGTIGGIGYSVSETAGAITINFAGSASASAYQAAIAAISFENISHDPASVDRIITATVSDGVDTSNTATSTIHVLPVNDAPAGADATLTTPEDIGYVFSAADFGFTDPAEGHGLQSVILTTLPANGTLTLGGAAVVAGQEIPAAQIGTLLFTPAAELNGPALASFTFQVRDTGGTANGGVDLDATPATITFNVAPVNDAPRVDLNSAATGLAGNPTGHAATYTEDTAAVAFTDSGLADMGDVGEADITALTIVATGIIDGSHESVIIAGKTFDLSVDGFKSVTLGGTKFLIDYDAASQTFSITNFLGASLPMPQAALDALLRAMTYQDTGDNPTAGDRTFTFTATDAGGLSSAAAVSTVTVAPVNDAPTATNNLLGVFEDGPSSASGNIITGNTGAGIDSDPENSTLILTAIGGTPVTGPTTITGAYGTLTVQTDGSTTYTLDPNNAVVQSLAVGETLSENFGYTITDGLTSGPEAATNGALEGLNAAVTRNWPNATVPPGWFTANGTPDVYNGATDFLSNAWESSPDGGDFIHGIGYGVAASSESFGQVLTGLTPGQTYTVEFSQSLGNSIYTDPASTGAWQLTVAGATFSSTTMTTPALGVVAGWQAQSFTFVATAATETIVFQPLAVTGGRVDMAIDGISVAVAGIPGLTASATLTVTINGSNDAPIIDLNSTATGADADRGNAVTYVEDASPVAVAANIVGVSDLSEADISRLTIVAGGIVDGGNEQLGIAGKTFDLTTDAVKSVTVGGTALQIAYVAATQTFTVSNAAGAATPIPPAVLALVVQSVSYADLGDDPTAGDRTFAFSATDTQGATGPAAIATVTVEPVNDLPVAPDSVTATPAAFGTIIVTDPPALSNPLGSAIGGPGTEALYAGIGTTADGQAFDVRVTYVSSTGSNLVDFTFDPVAERFLFTVANDGTTAPRDVVLRLDYFIAGTNTPIAVAAALSFDDLDKGTFGTEKVSIAISEIVSHGTTPGTTIATTEAAGTVTFAATRNDATDTDPNHAAQVTIENQTATLFTVTTRATGNTAIRISGTPLEGFAGGDHDKGTVSEDDVLEIRADAGLLQNDSDPDGDTLLVNAVAGQPAGVGQPVALASGAVVTVNADGSYRYDPHGRFEHLQAGETATDTFSYEVSDGYGGTDKGTVSITITGVNDAPVAVADTNDLTEDSATASGNVLGNDTDAESDPLIVTTATQGAAAITLGVPFTTAGGGVLTLAADGSYSFVPGTAYNGLDAGEQATETISYSISDGHGGTATAQLVITINGANDRPVIIDPANPGTPSNPAPATDPLNIIPDVSSNDGTALTPIDVAAFVVDPDGEALDFTLDPATTPAWLAIDPVSGQITGTPPANASQGGNTGNPGEYLITITATDPDGASVTTTVTLTIVNLPPVAGADTSNVTEDTLVVSGDVLGNDHDTAPDSDPLVVASAVQGSELITLGMPFTTAGGGVLTLSADGSYDFVPGTAYNDLDVTETATETIVYSISDGQGGTATAQLVISITGANDTPVVINPANPGTAANPLQATDPLNVIPDIVTSDGTALTPIEVGDFIRDPDGEPLAYTLDPATTPAWLSIDPATGSITGIPPANASQGSNTGNPGEYLISITATDPDGAMVTTTVILSIINLPPVAMADAADVAEDGTLADSVLGNDHDTAPDADALLVAAAMQGSDVVSLSVPFTTAGGGVLTLHADGSYSFDPGTAYNGLDAGETAMETISYSITDSQGGTATAHLVISIRGANDVPVMIDPANPGPSANPVQATDPLNIIPDVTTSDGAALTPIEVASFVADPDGEPLTFVLDPATTPGWLALDPVTGQLTGTPPANASQGSNTGNPGEYLITLTATDPDGASVTTTVTLTIINLPPVAQDDTASAGEDVASVTGQLITDPLTGDHDTAPDSDPLTVNAASQAGTTIAIGAPFTLAGGGVLQVNADGSYSVAPGTAYNGLDAGETATETISYTVSDGNGGIAMAQLVITINGANDRPVMVDPANPGTPNNPIQVADPLNVIADLNGADGTPITPIAVAPFVVDPDGEPLTFALDPMTTPAWLVIDPVSGLITGTPPADASQDSNTGNPGEYLITLTATDPDGAVVTTTVTLSIINLPPVAAGDAVATAENAMVTGNVLVSNGLGPDHDTAPDNDPIAVGGVITGAAAPLAGVGLGVAVAGDHGGQFTVQANGAFAFQPGTEFDDLAPGETRATTVTYRIEDGQGGSATATLTVTVTGTNDAPRIVDPATGLPALDPAAAVPTQVTADGARLPPLDVSGYFADLDLSQGPPVLIVDPALLPPGIVFSNGVFSGTPTASASQGSSPGQPAGFYVVPVTGTDPSGATVVTYVTFSVDNPAPVMAGDMFSVNWQASQTGSVAALASDPDGDALSFALVTAPTHGTLSFASDGSYTYTPQPGYQGADSFVVSVRDADGAVRTATIAITVVPGSTAQNVSSLPSPQPILAAGLSGIPGLDQRKELDVPVDSHGGVEVTYPNNAFIHFVVQDELMKLETQFGAGVQSMNLRYGLLHAVHDQPDNAGIFDALDDGMFGAGEQSLQEGSADGFAALLPVAKVAAVEVSDDLGDAAQDTFSRQVEALRSRFDRSALSLLADLARVA